MPENISQNVPPESSIDGYAYAEIQRSALRELLKLSAEAVAPLEADIEQQLQRGCAAAETRLAEVAARAEQRYRDEVAQAERAHAERVRQAEAEYAAAEESLARQVQQSQDNIAAGYQDAQRRAHRQREDNLLMIDTAARATLRGLREKLEFLERDVAYGRKQLESLQAQALQALAEHDYDFEQEPIAAREEPAGADDPASECKAQAAAAGKSLSAMRALAMPPLLVGAPAAAWLTLLNAGPLGVLAALGVVNVLPAPTAAVSAAVVLGVTMTASLVAGHVLRRKARLRIRAQLRAEYAGLSGALLAAGRALEQHYQRAGEQLRQDEAKAVERHHREKQAACEQYDAGMTKANRLRAEVLQSIENDRSAQHARNEQGRAAALQQGAEDLAQRSRESREQHDLALSRARQEHDRASEACRRHYESARAGLVACWTDGLARIRRLLDETERLDGPAGFQFTEGALPEWSPPQTFVPLIPFGRWQLDLTRLADSVRTLGEFLADRPPTVPVPALLLLPTRCSLFLETERAGRQAAINALRAVMLRLLTSLPAGRVRFTIIDPVGLGENFAGFMHLVDYEEALVGGRIWTESEHIEARLTELTSHMENVIQKYLRNEFESIDAYNRQAGDLAEPYRFLVIADFPAKFNEEALHRLTSIVSSGARCGVFTLIAHDRRSPAPPGLCLEDLTSNSFHLVFEGDRFVLQDELLRQFPLALDEPPSEEALTQLMHAVGRATKDALRVELPFEAIAPQPAQYWTGAARTEVVVPLGNAGAVRLQQLRLGRGLAQHALIAGKTGSGKSNLLHVMITNLALWYSPDEVEFYLVDFKKGVEFKVYVTQPLPHARAIAIESDREFGVSVLQRIDAELSRRGELFRAAGVQDLATYREVTGAVLPRTLLIVDEFQVFFTEDDRLSHDAGVLLDRLVRQGRAFGIHVLLGSQTLGGSTGLARSTIGQMAVRIALQCSEADSQLILDDTNVAARLLSRPGEAIYNDAGGLVAGNSPFQIAWLPDEIRNVYLERVCELAREQVAKPGLAESRAGQVRVHEPAIVFEGNAPADIRQNRLLARLLELPMWPASPGAPQAWLGEAVAIKDPTAAVFRRQSGDNLLIVGQRDDAALALMASMLISLAAQLPPQAARFVILDVRPAVEHQPEASATNVGGSEHQLEAGATSLPVTDLRELAAALPHETRFVAWRDVAGAMADLAAETQRRVQSDDLNAPAIFLFVFGLQRYRMLRRREEDFSLSLNREDQAATPDKQFAELLREGPPFGVHVVAWSDTLATVDRTLERQSVGEFDYRVLFQMSAADSSHLIDSLEANRLGFYRALLYSEEHGLLEKFRPYAGPDGAWLAHAGSCLNRRQRP
jgi:S-DNA-T family DNA segregation ATPase FtsK/SpoIIIE